MNTDGRDISGTRLEIAEIVIDSEGITSDIAIAEILRDPGDRWQLRLVAGRLCRDVLLEARQVHHRVRLRVGAAVIGINQIAFDVKRRGQRLGNYAIRKWNRGRRLCRKK